MPSILTDHTHIKMAPMLFYGYYMGGNFAPCPRRVFVYLAEKKIPSSVLTVVNSDEEAVEKGYPKKPEGFVPILAIPKEGKEGEYTWMYQSVAILEFLEDYCDAHPEVTSVPSMRGRASDPVHRAQIRGAMYWADELFEEFGVSCMFGNKDFISRLQRTTASPQSAKEVKTLADRTLRYLDQVLPAVSDYEGLSSGKEGVATIADCVLFATWQFSLTVYGTDIVKGYSNVVKVIEAFKNRPSAYLEPFPSGFKVWTDWYDGVWNSD